jgi:radical SAM superfamily enzyme YgiQ (UPF0313 family)
MASILMIAINRERIPYPVTPIGAAMVTAALQDAGHQVRLLDLVFVFTVGAAIRKAIRNLRPDIVALSMRNLDNCIMCSPHFYLYEVAKVVDLIRKTADVPIIIGGPGFSLAPKAILDALNLQWGVVGEGEIAVVNLVEQLLAGNNPCNIQGIVTRKHAVAKAGTIPDLDILPFQDYRQLPLKAYVRCGSFAGVQTRRGCTLGCIYCVYPYLEGHKIRLRSPKAVVEEVSRICQDTGCRHFYWADSAFNFPPDHAHAVCDELIKRELNITWQAYVNPIGMDGNLVQAMKVSGCVGLELGIDSASDPMLHSLRKGFSQETIAKASEAINRAGIPLAVHLLFGGPGETWTTIKETADFLDKHVPSNAVFANIGIRVFRNTPIWHKGLTEGWIDPGQSLLKPYFYCSPQLGKSTLKRLDNVALDRPAWTTPTDWYCRPMNIIQRIMGRFQVRPLWKNVAVYGRNLRPKLRRMAR